ncbi:signal transduction histidine kinase [Jejuia pallidilutea]|uniref:histidine kinase n=1 Tax=Jejuia pallidilutea TaxID=504487 RepID=A0A362X0N9_9FLAO|nr:hybrid sensor histidine kinase/response regulator transcription factor [Jejuia pallidilutea]PQV48968.1 signal transduction histidine kinase [Jejuia pallidilutea]
MLQRFVLLYIMLFFLCSQAQNIKFEHYNDNNGLSHNSVRHIVQDKHGFLWIGTFSGLNRFDGYEFKSYLSTSEGSNKINNDDITALELDEDANQLWIGTRKGLTVLKLDTYKFTTFLNDPSNPNSLPEDEIRSVYVDKIKRVWIGTKEQGLHIFYVNENRFEKINLPNFRYIKEIFEDSHGNIWIGSYESASIAKLTLDDNGAIQQTTTFTLKVPYTTEINPYLNFIYEDSKKDIFVGTRKGLYKLNEDKNQFENLYIENDEIRDALGPYIVSVAQSPKGEYWVGTLGGLLVCNQLEDIAVGDFQWYYSVLTDQTSLVDNLVSGLFFDATGILWIGTEDGLDKYDPYENQFHFNKDISKHIEGQAPRIRGFAKTYNNKIVAATRHNGLFIEEDDGFVPLFNNQKDIANIYSKDGKIFYCGLWNGKVLIYDFLNNTATEVNVGFEDIPISDIQIIHDDNIVVGSFGQGANILKIKSSNVLSDGTVLLEDGNINEITMDSIGNVWFATEAGVVKYNTASNTKTNYTSSFNKNTGLPHYNVSDIIFDNSGQLWAATREGLSIFDDDKNNFMPLTGYNGLARKWVTDMLLDSNGNLWLNVNNNSVAKINPTNNNHNIYHVNSGNRLDFFSSRGFFNYDDSNIYLGGKNGIIFFSPYSINENKQSPSPIITELKIDNEVILPGTEINDETPLTVDLNETKSVNLGYKNRNFSLQFSSPSYTNERLNKFQYKLENFDDDWITTSSNSRTVQYTNLFPGKYVFKIKASNSDGHWSDEVAYNIKIERPFWLTYQALFLFLLLIAIIIYFIRREVRNRMRLKQELVTEKVNRERDVKLNNEKLRFFTNISHELRTPLTLILGPVTQLLEESKHQSTDYQKSRYNLIHQNASRLLNLVNQVLDFRKAQTGELKLKVSKTDILQYTHNTFDSFKELAYNKQIQFNFNRESEELFGWIDRDKYDKILYNLLSNAIKFTNKFGHVDLYVGLKDNEDGYLIMEVSDDGIGIPKNSQEKIFTRFYQATNSKENNTGSGIGLSLVKSLVELHKGEIHVKSAPNKGSVFTVTLPMERHFYDDDEIFEIVTNKEKNIVVPKVEVKKTTTNTNIKEKILVIEDNLELRKYLVDYLSNHYKVYEAENGKEGLQLCRQVKPILCVADVMMPVMDGLEFCKELKNDEFISHIPVILLTALSENEDMVKGFDVGADGYLAKPFDPSLLKSRIVNIIKTRLELKSKFSDEADSEVGLLVHSPIDKEFMEKVSNLIGKNLSNPDLTTSFLCDKLGVSSSKLYRKIKELTDLSPNEFIRTVRLKKSAQYLKSKKYNVSEVTDLVGFNDPLYFSRCFKKQFGFPPSKLIK